MTGGDVSPREAQLTEGYARVHELELSALRLQRQCDELLARDAEPSEVSASLAERRSVEMELVALRRQLERYRLAG